MAIYTPIALNNGLFEIQSLTGVVFNKVSAISEKPVVGAKYYNPNTKKSSVLYGATEYDPITAEMLLSAIQFQQFLAWKSTPAALNGTLTATHQIGSIITTLLGVRYGGHNYGEIDKLSNDASMLTVTLSFEGIK